VDQRHGSRRRRRDRSSKLKQQIDGEIVVYASGQLVHTLMEHDLVDELRLMIYPCVLGAGERLFGPTRDQKRARLVDARIVGDSLAFLTYEVARDAPTTGWSGPASIR
jgi:dihydrofolate reductase